MKEQGIIIDSKNRIANYGVRTTVYNKSKVGNSKMKYELIWTKNDGNSECLMFTQTELNKAKARAEKNPEDIPALGLLSRILNIFI